MRFIDLDIQGPRVIELESHEDERGAFARTWCRQEFAARDIPQSMVQSSISINRRAGTLRGLHFQTPPSREGKLVRCTRGEIFDVIVDLRRDRESFLKHYSINLSGANYKSLYVPPGFAHGFQTLEDNTEVLYMMTDFFEPNLSTGVRFNDAAFGIEWPITPPNEIAPRDASYPDFVAVAFDLFEGY